MLRKVRVRWAEPALEQDVHRQAFLRRLQIRQPPRAAARRGKDLQEVVGPNRLEVFIFYLIFTFVFRNCVIYVVFILSECQSKGPLCRKAAGRRN